MKGVKHDMEIIRNPDDINEWLDRILVNRYKQWEENKRMDKKWYYAIAYVLSIVFANLIVAKYGLVTWFNFLVFPAGAIFIGLCFTLRDFVQRYFGHRDVWWFMIGSTVITVLMGVALSHLPIPLWKVALASGVAFLVSESIDWAVYYFLKKDLIWRICVSNLISVPIDSILFVGIAFGAFSFLAPPVWGQTIVKYISGLLIIPVLLYFRKRSKQAVMNPATN